MPIYLDYNATSPLRPQALAKMQQRLAIPANPSSAHNFGREAKKQLEDARKIIAETISVWANEIIFTASGTEANITALSAFPERRLLLSEIEHSSALSIKHDEIIKVDANGIINLANLELKLAENQQPALVCVMLANNETGVIQPISEVAEICKKHGALLHVDAVQALGKIPVDFSLLSVDMLSISAHKCGGALGAAALVVKNNLSIKPLLTGGGQELGRRAGTENIAAIAAFAVALEAIDFKQMQNLRDWLDEMEEQMQLAGGIIFGKDVPRLPNTTCVAMPNVGNEVQLIDFDLNGYAVSAGSACSSGRIEKSHVLLAMGVAPELAACAIRISVGWNTTKDEIEKFTQAWLKLSARLRK
ncbi:MAG: cysteine desulfurase family protein [Rickettsiales bacterium]|jgi:cysteine desulfurase